MQVCLHNDTAVFRTHFDGEYDLIQQFRGMNNTTTDYNAPVDFMLSGLMKKTKMDSFRPDVILSYMTDEASPCLINGSYIGANHGHHGAVNATIINHGLSFKDIASEWIDQNGVRFTLVRIKDQNSVQFLSQNVGESIERYQFVTKITGNLVRLTDEKELIITAQHDCDLWRANRYVSKKLITFNQGKADEVIKSQCDYAQIYEHYYIINPATVLSDLVSKRPENGYEFNPDLAQFGLPMMEIKLTYTITEDGTVLCAFDNQKLMDVSWTRYLGVMFQEKPDLLGGGVYRFLPHTLPLDCSEGVFDFNNGVLLSGAYPTSKMLTPEFYADPDNPPNRIIDVLKDNSGANKLGFACGFLPVFDGENNVRKNTLDCACPIYSTRKAYPVFAEGNITKIKGVGYKKYFTTPKDKGSYYTINFDGTTYFYALLTEQTELNIRTEKPPKLIQSDSRLTVQTTQDKISLKGIGAATFIIK